MCLYKVVVKRLPNVGKLVKVAGHSKGNCVGIGIGEKGSVIGGSTIGGGGSMTGGCGIGLTLAILGAVSLSLLLVRSQFSIRLTFGPEAGRCLPKEC